MRRAFPILIAVACLSLATATAVAQRLLTEDFDDIRGRIKARQRGALIAGSVGLLNLSNQLQPIYRHELMYVRGACGLSKETFQKMRPEADAAYAETIKALRTALGAAQRSGDATEPDYRAAIRKAVHSVAKRHVTPEQWARLQADLPLRASARKAAGVDMLVALIDRELLLTTRQREQVIASLSVNWDDSWCDAIEAAFNARPIRPPFRDELVTAFLKDKQRETWHMIPVLPCRLWGVVFDHGGDSDMEEALGAVVRIVPEPPGSYRQGDQPPHRVIGPLTPAPRPQPRDFAARRILRVIQPVPEMVLVAPNDAQDEEKKQAARRREALRRARLEQLERAYFSAFQREVYGRGWTPDATRVQSRAALVERVVDLDRMCDLSATQKRKLMAAGHGDIKHFFDAIEEVRNGIHANIENPARLREILISFQALAADRQALLAVRGSIFTRVLPRTLTDDQSHAVEHDAIDRRAFRLRADIAWTAVLLARGLGMTDDRRRQLETIVRERSNRTESFEIPDHQLIMIIIASIPKDELRPIFDDLQWRVLSRELIPFRHWLGLRHDDAAIGN